MIDEHLLKIRHSPSVYLQCSRGHQRKVCFSPLLFKLEGLFLIHTIKNNITVDNKPVNLGFLLSNVPDNLIYFYFIIFFNAKDKKGRFPNRV